MRTGARILVVGLLLGLVPSLPAAAETAAGAEAAFVELINSERSSSGAGRLAADPELTAAARGHAARMRDAGRISHSPDLASVTTGWQLLGENVGVGPSSGTIHAAFMASTSHRANVLDRRYTHVGIGVVAEGSRLWVVEMFMQGTGSSYTPPFRDDDGSPHEGDIARLAAAGITGGCGAGRYCPWAPVTRGEMATFLARALALPAAPGDAFSDDGGSVHEKAIDSLAAAGITSGCGRNRFCPGDAISRGEMAALLARALGLPAASRDYFSDDDGFAVEDAANRLAAAGITTGCSPRRFCPLGAVTREQMATFLVRALGV